MHIRREGASVNIEVQKEDNDDHEPRVYYNGASMVINNTPPNVRFADIARGIVIFISSFDIFGGNEVVYETVKVDRKSKDPRRSPVAEF